MSGYVASVGRVRIRMAIGSALLAVMLDGTVVARGQDWKAPTQFVGFAGQVGNYEDVQQSLDHLEWQDVRHTTDK